MLILIIFFSILGSIGSIIVASVFLMFKEETQHNLIPKLISYATGTLLAAALLGLLNNALNLTAPIIVMGTLLFGLITFFILEKLVIWRHCHKKDCQIHKSSGPIILIGDGFHNLIDGIIIAASFLTSFELGVIISISIIGHEIPQEVGDIGILLNSGYSKKKAFALNMVSSLTTLIGGILGYFFLDFVQNAIPLVMAFSAASFLYIALADLLPQLNEDQEKREIIMQFILILAGIGTILLILLFHP